MKIGKFIKYGDVWFYAHPVLKNMGGVLPRVVCCRKRWGGMYINKEWRWGGVGWGGVRKKTEDENRVCQRDPN